MQSEISREEFGCSWVDHSVGRGFVEDNGQNPRSRRPVSEKSNAGEFVDWSVELEISREEFGCSWVD